MPLAHFGIMLNTRTYITIPSRISTIVRRRLLEMNDNRIMGDTIINIAFARIMRMLCINMFILDDARMIENRLLWLDAPRNVMLTWREIHDAVANNIEAIETRRFNEYGNTIGD